MKLIPLLPGVLALLNLNCGDLPAQRGDARMTQSPWELRLSVEGGVKLRAALYNRAPARQTYLYHAKLQPLEPVLTSPSGQRIEPFDTREEAKFDNTVYREMFREAEPGVEVPLAEAALDSDRSLRMGPYLFTNLAAGKYRAQVTWRSEKDHYVDRQSKRTSPMKNVWLGTVTSNTVELTVP